MLNQLEKYRVLLLAFVLFSGGWSCTVAPYRVVRETRVDNGFLVGFSKRIVTLAPLATDGQHLFVALDRQLLRSFSGQNGRKRWQIKTDGAVTTGFAFTQDALIVGTENGTLYKVNKSNGDVVWSYQAPVALIGGVALNLTQVVVQSVQGHVYCFNLKTGELLWRFRHDLKPSVFVHGYAPPLFAAGAWFVAFADGRVIKLSEQGEELWRVALDMSGRFSDVVGLGVDGDHEVWAAQLNGSLSHVNIDDGQVARRQLLAGSVARVLQVDQGWIYPLANHELVMIRRGSNDEAWRYQRSGSAGWSGLATDQGKLLAASYDGRVDVVDLKDGSLLWSYDLGSAVQGPPVVIAGKIWLLSQRGELFALR